MIYLASASPRRQELLRQIGIDFEVLPSNVEESRAPGETPQAYVTRVALDKARFVMARVRERGLAAHPVLGADTEVVLGDEILGKPRDGAHAREMLARLAGKTHEVLTAVVVVDGEHEWSALSHSRVTFGELGREDIERYWASGEPADKAGAYGIQGHGARFIARLEGSYTGVVGLPLYETSQLLARAGIRV